MNSKKAITLLVLATLLLSTVPIAFSYGAIDNVAVENPHGTLLAAMTKIGYGQTLIITGDGVTAGKLVKAYWDAVDDWDGEVGLLNSTKAKSNGEFEIWIDVPSALYGDHYIWLEDANTGETYMVIDAVVVDSYIKVTPSSGLPGDTITIKGYGYGDEEDITVKTFDGDAITTSPGTPETTAIGYWQATFKVPDEAYASYDVVCTNGAAHANTTSFTIGPAITLSVTEGPVGTVVRATGRGFEESGAIDSIEITDGVTTWTCVETDPDDLEISSSGKFTVDFVIPVVDEVNDDYEITISDGTDDGSADFEVTGLPGLETDPEYGVQGASVAIHGYNFTAITGEEVELYIDEVGAINPLVTGTKVGTYDTNRYGGFTGTFQIPGLSSGPYELYAYQEDWEIDNTEDPQAFKVGLMIVILSPSSGPAGTKVTITGSGFETDTEWNATLGDELIVESDNADGDAISEPFWVPSIAPGVYTVSVYDFEAEITVTSEFEITETTYVTTDPLVAPNDYNVTIEGFYFAADPEVGQIGIDFVIWNATDDWDLDVWVLKDPDTTDDIIEGEDPVELTYMDDWDDGFFRGWFMVPDSDTLSVGIYTINITDGHDMFAQYTLEIVSKTVDIEPRKSTFKIGETVNFVVESSFIQDASYIKIWTPTGDLYWKTDAFEADDWVAVETLQRYPYFSQTAGGNLMTLLDDAPLGVYTWTWYDVDAEELDDGTFTVTEADADVLSGQVQDLNNQITDLADQLTSVSSEFDSVKSDIADVAAIAQQAATAAQQAAEAVTSVAQTANTASQAAADAATAANAARDAANGLTTLVYGAIGAALVAALAAIVSLMQISKRIAG